MKAGAMIGTPQRTEALMRSLLQADAHRAASEKREAVNQVFRRQVHAMQHQNNRNRQSDEQREVQRCLAQPEIRQGKQAKGLSFGPRHSNGPSGYCISDERAKTLATASRKSDYPGAL